MPDVLIGRIDDSAYPIHHTYTQTILAFMYLDTTLGWNCNIIKINRVCTRVSMLIEKYKDEINGYIEKDKMTAVQIVNKLVDRYGTSTGLTRRDVDRYVFVVLMYWVENEGQKYPKKFD